NNDRESDFCYTYGSTLSWNVGTSDGASGLNFLCALLPPPSQQPGYGEIGQIALGGRSSKTVYTPGSAVPRPDLDLSIARTGDEQKPVGSVEASLPVTYGIPELPLPDNFKHDPFNLDASLVVTPTINNRFASQFQIYGS